MRHPMRALALACALTLTPACAALQIGQTRMENPFAAAQTIDQRAYALLHSYAAIVEEATDIVADPATPIAFKRALGQAEQAATPAVEILQVATTTYVRARADFDASANASQTTLQRATTALSIAARRLSEAYADAQAPIAQLEGLVRANRG